MNTDCAKACEEAPRLVIFQNNFQSEVSELAYLKNEIQAKLNLVSPNPPVPGEVASSKQDRDPMSFDEHVSRTLGLLVQTRQDFYDISRQLSRIIGS